jgi:glycosyltransferase involved in cell wall biosynthesis
MLIEQKVVRPEKVSVIYNGGDHLRGIDSDTSRLDQLGLLGRPYILAAANAQHHKNIKILFDVFAGESLREVTLLLVGPDDLDTLINAGLKPPPNAIMAGYVSDQQLKALYENAACMAFPSLTEGFGLPPVEAMSLGCPAVVSPAGALREICQDGAIYAAPDQPQEWEDAILQILRNPDFRRRQISAGLARSEAFSWAKAANQWKALIESSL